MKIAVEGCSHGELDAIYASILLAESRKGFKTDLLLLCGDFQAIRNRSDLQCLAVPDKFRQLGEFHKYYSGEKVAPVLTLVIGGNHEASNYMWELFHGGWLAPNIYYLGAAGCVEVGGLRIGGISGIYKGYDYPLGRFERMPYSKSDIRSIYHTRLYDVLRLKLLASSESTPTIVLSHDWPNQIERSGDFKSLIRKKKFFANEIRDGNLGSPPLMELMQVLKPKYWFSAHLHVKFSCIWKFEEMERKQEESTWGPGGWYEEGKEKLHLDGHDWSAKDKEKETPQSSSNPEALDFDDDDNLMDSEEPPHDNQAGMTLAGGPNENPDEIAIAMDEDEGDAGLQSQVLSAAQKISAGQIPTPRTATKPSLPPPVTGLTSTATTGATHFLALSKCLPNQEFLQFLDIPTPYDECLSSISSRDTFESASSSRKLEFQGAGISVPNDGDRRFPPLRFNSRWLAITRALHHFLCLERVQTPPLPGYGDPALEQKINEQGRWIEQNLMKRREGEASGRANEVQADQHPLAVGNVQGFVRTAPTPSEPGGNENSPPHWYTNPQTESFCAFLQVPNLINPSPQHQPPPIPPPSLRLGNLLPADGFMASVPSSSNLPPQPPTAPARDREAEEIAKIKESAERRRKEREGLKEKRKLEQCDS